MITIKKSNTNSQNVVDYDILANNKKIGEIILSDCTFYLEGAEIIPDKTKLPRIHPDLWEFINQH